MEEGRRRGGEGAKEWRAQSGISAPMTLENRHPRTAHRKYRDTT